ncbi:MAG: hypothetical protein EOM20_19125 [Spartobacteria bacterium]|nr:hypothetical protein [Spartobacteria bacterium]
MSRVDVTANTATTNLVVSFASEPHRLYTLQYRTDLRSGSWSNVAAECKGSGSPIPLTNDWPASTGYYRLKIQAP